MDSDHIGEYIFRVRENDPMGENPLTKGHRIESHVADRFVTHCGRELEDRDGTGFHFEIAIDPAVRCLRC